MLTEVLATTAMVHHATRFRTAKLGLIHVLLILRLVITTQQPSHVLQVNIIVHALILLVVVLRRVRGVVKLRQ